VNPYESPKIGDPEGLIQVCQPRSEVDRWWLFAAYSWPWFLFLLLPAAQIIPVAIKILFLVVSLGCLLRLLRGIRLSNCTYRLLAIAIHLYLAFLVVIFPATVPPGLPKPY
jgi:hypothetical protein